MNEPRKPLFGFIFTPKPPTAGQERWLRIPPRGPWRLALLIAATLVLSTVAGSALLALSATRTREALVVGALGLVIVIPFIAVVARGWVVGTYVNDAGVRVVRMWRSEFAPWVIVTDISIREGHSGKTLVVETTEGPIVSTIGSQTLDTFLRDQTWHSSVDRIRLWHRESRAHGDS